MITVWILRMCIGVCKIIDGVIMLCTLTIWCPKSTLFMAKVLARYRNEIITTYIPTHCRSDNGTKHCDTTSSWL